MDSIPLLCPTCSEQALQTTATALGSIERCPSCGWFFIDLKTLAGYSEDKDQFNALIAEAKQFLLPTGRDCPKGAHKLQDGRVRSRGVILTLCPRCETLWTDLDTLGRLNEALERSLRAQLETTVVSPESGSAGDWRPGFDAIAPVEDKGFAGFLRQTAHFFNGLANRYGKPKPLPTPRAQPAPAPVSPPSVLESEMRPQAAVPIAPIPEPPKPAPKELVIPELPVTIPEPEPEIEPLPAPIVEEPPKPVPKPKPEPPPEPEPEPIPEPRIERLPESPVEPSGDREDARRRILNNLGKVEQSGPAPKRPATPKKWVNLPQPESLKKGFLSRITDSLKLKAKPPKAPSKPATPVPDKKSEEAVAIPAPSMPEKILPVVSETPKAAKRPKKLGFFDLFKPLPKAPKPSVPVIRKSPEPSVPMAKTEEPTKPAVIKVPDKVEQPKPKDASAIAQFFALFKPLPKPPKAVPPVKATSEIPVPIPVPVQAPPPEPEKPPKPKFKPKPEVKPEPEPVPSPVPVSSAKKAEKSKSSAMAQFFALFKPLPKKEKLEEPPVPKAAETKPALPTVSEIPPPPVVPVPEKSEPLPVVPAAVAEKKSSWKGRLVIWLPRLVPVAVVLILGIAGDDEWGTAFACGIASWAMIRLIYLALMYPFKGFSPMNVADLVSGNRPRLKGKPVQLKGRLEIRSGNGVSLVDGTGDVPLDRFASWEFAARLLAVANLGQYAKEEEVTIQGWYRSSASPFVEVNEIRTPKATRKSMVRWMRWGAALVTLIVSSLILFGMD